MTTTDYPTRTQMYAAAETIDALQNAVDRSVPGWGATWSFLKVAREILDNLDAFPGLHLPDADPEPEPEPQPTAAEVLRVAHERLLGLGLSAEMQIIGAAVTYAEDNPRWFLDWHDYEDANASLTAAAAQVAVMAADDVALDLLTAAAGVAKAHPELFGGDA